MSIMELRRTTLSNPAHGTLRELVSLHYGTTGSGPKVVIQASLHADELPGMLVVHHLRQLIDEHERAGRIIGKIVLLPVANPIGLAQSVLRVPVGRFEMGTGENFNRNYPALTDTVIAHVDGLLSADPNHNRGAIRAAMRKVLSGMSCSDELSSLRRALLLNACDADVVLDLHCDFEAVLHMYVGTPLWPSAEPLARLLGAEAVLLATDSGDNPFDEACSKVWWEASHHFGERFPIPLACLATTIELRGSSDVNHSLARKDAAAIISFLIYRGVLRGDPVPLPRARCAATPLAGSMPIETTRPGILVFTSAVGAKVAIGDCVAEIVDPLSGEVTQLLSPVEGILYARESRRYVTAGTRVAKIAGAHALRNGKLLSA